MATVWNSNTDRHAAGVDAVGSTLAVRRLVLTDFRNYQAETLAATGRPVVLCGPNGSGKTNILEAISYLSPGRGLRRAPLRDVSRIGGNGGWAVAATLEIAGENVRIGTGLQRSDPPPDDGSERRTVRIEGEAAKGPAALADYVRLVWLTPQMDRLFVEGPSSRRRFLDRLVLGFDASHGARVSAYERAMRERTHLLRAGQADPGWLDALEARMAENSVAIAAARRDVVARLRGSLAAGIGPFPRAELGLTGFAEERLAHHSALDVENALSHSLAEARRRDREAGRASTGAHRADLVVTHMDKGMPAELCSTGEQKALLVAIVLGDARLQAVQQGSPPLLLLDEIAAHLDGDRRAALVDEILGLGAQAWMTGTDRGLFKALEGRAQFFDVMDGKVTANGG